MGYSLAHVDDIEPGGPGGAVRFVRRELGVEAFGINWFELPRTRSVASTTKATPARKRSTSSSAALAPTGSRASTFRFEPGRSSASTRDDASRDCRAGRDDDHRGRRAAGELRAAGPVLSVLVRLLIWNVADSQTTIDELRESLPELEPPSRWIWNEVTSGSASWRSATSSRSRRLGAGSRRRRPRRLRGIRLRVGHDALGPGVESIALVHRERA